MLSSTAAKHSLIEVSPLLISSTHSPLSSSRDSNMSSTSLLHTLRCRPGHGLKDLELDKEMKSIIIIIL